MDKREERTLESVYNSLSKLIKAKDYESLKVEDILKEANISRSTFYAHFKSKDDVLSSFCDQLFAHVFSFSPKKENSHDFSNTDYVPRQVMIHLAIHIYEDKDLIGAILKSSGRSIFTSRFSNLSTSLIEKVVYSHELYKEEVPIKLQCLQLTDSFVSILCHWVEMGTIVSPETIIDYFYRLHI